MRTLKLVHGLTAAATATLTVAIWAGTAGALNDGDPGTLTALHQAGCVPVVSLDAGTNDLAYRGAGRDACKGQQATIVYDGEQLSTEVVDLGAGQITITPPCGEEHVQTDLFAGDITHQIGGPQWNPAWRLITVSWLDGAPCELPPATIITYQTTPAPAPTFPTPTIPPTVDEPLLPQPPITTTTVVETTEPPTTTVAEPTPELPVTGGNVLPIAVAGASMILAGAALRHYSKQ